MRMNPGEPQQIRIPLIREHEIDAVLRAGKLKRTWATNFDRAVVEMRYGAYRAIPATFKEIGAALNIKPYLAAEVVRIFESRLMALYRSGTLPHDHAAQLEPGNDRAVCAFCGKR